MSKAKTMDVKGILKILKFTPPLEAAVTGFLARRPERITALAASAYDGAAPDFPLLKRMPLTRLAILVHLLVEQYDAYRALDVPETIIEESFRDVSLRAERYFQKQRKAGLEKDDVIWFRHLIQRQIFKIGVLQFQIFKMIYLDEEFLGEAYMTFSPEQKQKLPSGSPVINVHIQEGTALDPEKVAQSFATAEDFFKKTFPQESFAAFLCYSWLLYPPTTAKLKDGSRIKNFARHFTIISAIRDDEQALEELFGGRRRSKKAYPRHSALQRMAVDDPHCLGYACGLKALGQNPANTSLEQACADHQTNA